MTMYLYGQSRPAQGPACLSRCEMTPELRREIADLSRTPPSATDRLKEQKVARHMRQGERSMLGATINTCSPSSVKAVTGF